MSPLWLMLPVVLVATVMLSAAKSPRSVVRSLALASSKPQGPTRPVVAESAAPTAKPETFKQGMEYPDTMRALAEKWATIFGVPSSWLVSQAYIESQNRPLITNARSGATGVLQIKLVRARDLVKWINRSKWRSHPKVQAMLKAHWHDRREDLFNPDLNTMLASFDLHHLRAKFGNDHNVVAAAYNQGEGRISRHLAAGLPFPPRAIEYVARVERAKRRGYA